jgi:hypothetical protein
MFPRMILSTCRRLHVVTVAMAPRRDPARGDARQQAVLAHFFQSGLVIRSSNAQIKLNESATTPSRPSSMTNLGGALWTYGGTLHG